MKTWQRGRRCSIKRKKKTKLAKWEKTACVTGSRRVGSAGNFTVYQLHSASCEISAVSPETVRSETKSTLKRVVGSFVLSVCVSIYDFKSMWWTAAKPISFAAAGQAATSCVSSSRSSVVLMAALRSYTSWLGSSKKKKKSTAPWARSSYPPPRSSCIPSSHLYSPWMFSWFFFFLIMSQNLGATELSPAIKSST